MRVLVTGVAGFIGSHVAEALIARGDGVIGVDNFNAFYDPAIKEANVREVEARSGASHFRLVRADILRDVGALSAIFDQESTRPDVVCHLAAWAGVRPSIQDPLAYQSNNVEATVRLLELAKRTGVRPFVFASSSSVYGARTQVPFSEEDRVDDPVSPYAATKKAGELLGHVYHHLHGTRFIGLRFFTVYGPRQRPEMGVHTFARKMLDGEPITLYGDGSNSRDYTYVDDCARGVVAAIDRAHSTDGYRIYNLGSSDTVKLSELVGLLEKSLHVKATVRHAPDQPGDVPRTCADLTRARAELGYQPSIKIDAGIEKFARWLLRRRTGSTRSAPAERA